jgi:aminobenzoyl-glutamate utilization protein B
VRSIGESAESAKGSTDVGDISWFVPTGGLRTVCFIADGPGHSWQNAACIGSSIGEKGILCAARVLAVTAVELFERPEVVDAARADFQTRMQGRRYTTLIPEGQKAPVQIR